MRSVLTAITLAASLALLPSALTAAQPSGADGLQPAHARLERPTIDVAFVLDTTGSMTQLIQGAKVKIWSIAKEMLDAQVTPQLRIGLVGYRDRGDNYVTRVFDLTEDIDQIYGELLKFEADGGGDRPESVNQALDDAVNIMSWGQTSSAYKVVFLVGDSPPQMNYRDDVAYHATAKKAARKGIVINTILAGGARDTGAVWREIATLAQGRYAEIPQSGNMQVIETPYDQDIQSLNQRLTRTAIPYGNAAQQESIQRKLENSASAPSSVAADKSAYRRLKSAHDEVVTGAGELINDLALGVVSLEELEAADLPKPLQAMGPEEREAVIAQKTAMREELRKKLDALLVQREAYLQEERVSAGKSDSFDSKVEAIIREQGAAKGIIY
ncbi:VWA domain-containing protein [Pelagibius litoralis]|uniref:VWA domain-containing protein n=1 Tax=Pelagibius litoralis TaxID=374515 RepID=A0A967F2Q7_9PROT|nr:vWA domain-containing protein [Pelagibius litoralis]NIA71933.1 VWA domain-containing protein [Pelagibius litoralis]